MDEYLRAWRIENDKGHGFAVGDNTQTPKEAAEAEGFTEIEYLDPEHNVVCSDNEDLIVICECGGGPWAVRIPASDLR